MKRATAIGFLLFMCGAMNAAHAEVVLEARLWQTDFRGAARVSDGSRGTLVDLESDLGIGDEDLLNGRLTWRLTKGMRLWVDLTPISLDGVLDVQRTIDFGGQSFNLDTLVVSELDIDYWKAGFAWQFIGFGPVKLGPFIEAVRFDGSATLSAPELLIPLSASEPFDHSIAAAGLAVHVQATDRVRIVGEAAFLNTSDLGNFLDGEIVAYLFFTENIGAVVGYRQVDIEIDDNNDTIDFEFDGPFAGIGLRF